MADKIDLTKKFKLVKFKQVDISDDDKYIIGTHELSTCTGVLLYCEEKKRAIVGHVSSDWENVIKKTIELIYLNNLGNYIFKYKIIPGYDPSNGVSKKIEEVFISLSPMLVPFEEKNILDGIVGLDENTQSFEFAFDAINGKFVTDKVLFGIDYYKVCEDDNDILGKSR